jgi:hypothetical protein
MTPKAASWVAPSVVVATLSLFGALIFNDIQLRDSAADQRQTKLATELSLLTQMQNVITQSAYRRTLYARQFTELRSGRRDALSPAAYRATAEEAANMEYFAWLINKGHLVAHDAEELWGPQMVCEYERIFVPAFADAQVYLANLSQFVRKHASKLGHRANCT